jgi:catechol 2,3-dioxygenase-like lactoylglutathione lyase family enzyme
MVPGGTGFLRFASGRADDVAMTSYGPHHTALSVRDLRASKAFYGYFGFRTVAEWAAEDGSLTIAHLRLDDPHDRGPLLELFHYTENAGRPWLELSIGNDLPEVGVKHLGLAVPDVALARREIVAAGIGEVSPMTTGRTGVEYFFVRDPDGLHLEILHDPRNI